jgi:flavin reductase (DIM6/NTAB) family NADH-FMN oxidoreductase RutF
MVKVTDYIGTYSGLNIDKSRIFKIFYGKLSTAPMIEECPINIECKLLTVMDFGGKNDLFVGEIIETYSEDKYLTDEVPDMKKINPFVYSRYEHNYWGIGKYLGKASNVYKDFKP